MNIQKAFRRFLSRIFLEIRRRMIVSCIEWGKNIPINYTLAAKILND